MALTAFAGRFEPQGAASEVDPRPGLEFALRVDGPAASLARGPLAVAWASATPGPQSSPECAGSSVLCLVHGRPRADALVRELALDPSTPTRTVLALGYRRLGEQILQRVAGEYSLLLWDGAAGHGLLARDRNGDLPLFYAQRRGALLFASEVRNLLALLPTRPVPDNVAVAHWLARASLRSERTLYAGISRLPAAHALRFDRDGWRSWSYWQPRYAAPRRRDAATAAQEIRSALGRAVEHATLDVSAPGILLSGGLDSAAIGACVSTQGRDSASLTAYSAVFPGDPAVDESSRIAQVRDWLGLPGVEARFLGASALGAALEFLDAWALPSASPNVFIWLPQLRRAASDGVDVMLDGEGGDELFGCASYLIADLLRAGRPFGALRVARELPGMGTRPQPRWLWRALTSFGVRPALPHGLHQRLRRGRQAGRVPSWLGEEAARLLALDDDPWAWKRSRAPRWWAQLADSLTTANDALGAGDQFRREAALAGLEVRHPLRDSELIELVLGLEPELSFDAHLDRPLARRALAGELPPDSLANEDKPTFNSLLTLALDHYDRQALGSLLADPDPQLARHVRGAAVSLLERSPGWASGLTWALELWQLASLELWLEHQADPDGLRHRAQSAPGEPAIEFVRRAPAPEKGRRAAPTQTPER